MSQPALSPSPLQTKGFWVIDDGSDPPLTLPTWVLLLPMSPSAQQPSLPFEMPTLRPMGLLVFLHCEVESLMCILLGCLQISESWNHCLQILTRLSVWVRAGGWADPGSNPDSSVYRLFCSLNSRFFTVKKGPKASHREPQKGLDNRDSFWHTLAPCNYSKKNDRYEEGF